MADLPVEAPNEATLIGAQTVSPFNGSGDWIVTQAGPLDLRGHRDEEGRPHPRPGRLGVPRRAGEHPRPGGRRRGADAAPAATQESHYTATIYPGPKGNFVFNASTIFWAQGLSAPPGHMPPISHNGRPHGPDERVQRITKNVFERIRGS